MAKSLKLVAKIFVVLSIVIALVGSAQAQIDLTPKPIELKNNLEQLSQPQSVVSESLFIQVWELIGKIYLDSIPMTEEEVMNQYKTLRQMVQDNPTKKDSLVYAATTDLVKALGNKFSWFLQPEVAKAFVGEIKSYAGIGVGIGGFKKEPIITFVNPEGPAKVAGVKVGDVIKKIDGMATKRLSLEEVLNLMHGEAGKQVLLTVKRQKKNLEIAVTRQELQTKTVYAEMVDSVLYVQILRFTTTTGIEFFKVQKLLAQSQIFKAGCKGIIIDVRGNWGGGSFAVPMIARFWIEGTVCTFKFRDRTENLETGPSIKAFTEFFNMPTVVLMNQNSASGSEALAGCLRDYGAATLIGTESFGKGYGQAGIRFMDGSMLVIKSFLWETPKGVHVTEGNGLEPDIKVETTLQDIANGHDFQLEKALEFLMKNQPKTTIDLDKKVELKRTFDFSPKGQ